MHKPILLFLFLLLSERASAHHEASYAGSSLVAISLLAITFVCLACLFVRPVQRSAGKQASGQALSDRHEK